MRKRIYEIIEVAKKNDITSRIYDFFLIAVIGISLVPIIGRLNKEVTFIIDTFALAIFIGDYLLHWLTADYKFKSKSALSFIRYPFSFSAIIDLLVIISLLPLNYANSTLGLIEILRTVRVLHVFRLAHYSHSVELIIKVFRRQKNALLTVVTFAAFYILVTALVVFTAEPATFDSFFDAVYWATASLTTIGFGETVPTSLIGRSITMFSSLFGVLVVALPTGIITAGYVKIAHEEQRRTERLALAANEKIQAKVKKVEGDNAEHSKNIKKVQQENLSEEKRIKKVESENRQEEKKLEKVEKTLAKISEKWKSL